MELSYEELCAQFEHPPAAYRPMMFWIWNGELDEGRIVEQIEDMAEKGCGGFFIHPMGEEFRLKDFIKGISPPYLSDEYFAAVRVAVEAAQQQGLYAWLYDEGGWPSGTAQGHVLAGHPEHTAKVLRAERRPVRWGERVACPEGTVAALALLENAPPEALDISDGRVTAPDGASAVAFFIATEIEGRVDLLSPAAVRRFIEVTHERYAQCVGEFFGGVIPGIFTDEPAIAGRVGTEQIPWTDDFLATFEERRGFDLRPFLPALFADSAVGEGGHDEFEPHVLAQVRCEFCDHWTDLYHDAYWQQINEWCEAHNLIHTGHVGGEDNLPDHGKAGFGQFFKTAGALHAPGVDAIWRQLCWDKDNFSFPHFAASAAHQRTGQGGAPEEDSPFDNLVVTETNGVYGLGLTFEQMRWLVDYQGLCGVNLIAPMAYSYETAGGSLYRTQDHIGPGNPEWELYRGFADYVGRLCSVLRSGVALADVAVYYPIEAFWSEPEGEAAKRAWESVQEITRALREEQVAFDFIDAQAISDGSISEGALETPGQFYGTIIVPETPLLPVEVLCRLSELYESGGRVAFAGAMPQVSSDYAADEEFCEVADRLRSGALTLDADAESALGGETMAGIDEVARWDGLSAGLGMPRGRDRFPAEIRADQAILVAPEDEIGRLARLLALRAGRYSVQPEEIVQDLRLTARELGDAQVTFIMNEGQEELKFGLDIVTDRPSFLEHWDPTDGERHLLAVHEQVTEVTRAVVQLRPGESALLVLAPQEHERPQDASRMIRPRRPLQSVVIDELDEPAAVAIEAEHRIREGDVEIVSGAESGRIPPRSLGPWEEFELADFSGTVAYEFSFAVAAEYLEDEVFLDLGEVCYSAQLVLNGVRLPACLWRPYVMEVSDFLREHDNQLTVRVTNTLANQVCKEEVVQEARARGWFNTYYERALPMTKESLRSGLIGPVRLYVRQ